MTISSMTVSTACLTTANMAGQDGGKPVCFAAVDASGALIYLYRMDGAPERLINIAIGKAYTAARMEISTDAFRQRLLKEQLSLADFMDDKFTSLPGGQPLLEEEQLVGAIAVSGRALEEDVVLCQQFAERIQISL